MHPDEHPQITAFQELFTRYRRLHGIAGGWAVDFLTGAVRRDHSDLDVLVLAADFAHLLEVMRPFGPVVTDEQTNESRPAEQGFDIEPGRMTVSFTKVLPPECGDVQVLFASRDDSDWIFHRGGKIRWPLADLIRRSPGGIPYLTPEIVLLLKARDAREKDRSDFVDAVAHLDHEQLAWLRPRLAPPWKQPHPWEAVVDDALGHPPVA
ncbi:MAG: hypothetical protein HOU81_21440 [Hamadaea sp.]|nr:hypothetical protein [Hamadaea sp.]